MVKDYSGPLSTMGDRSVPPHLRRYAPRGTFKATRQVYNPRDLPLACSTIASAVPT
jgi:hypothetical protein